MATIDQWVKHANDLIQAGQFLFESSGAAVIPGKAADERVVALALLCRTIGHFKSMLLLVQHDRLTEARLLARGCYENLLYISAIREEGPGFIRNMERADLAYHKPRGESLLIAANDVEHEKDRKIALQKYLKKVKEKHRPALVAGAAGVSKGEQAAKFCIIYEKLSEDLVHPTIDALKQYFFALGQGGKAAHYADIEPAVSDDAKIQTLDWACSAMLGVLTGVNRILGKSAASQEITRIFSDCKKLTKAQTRTAAGKRTAA